MAAAQGLANIANKADDLNVARSAASASLNAVGISRAFDVIGRTSGLLDAGLAWAEVYNQYQGKGPVSAGSVAKAVFKTILIGAHINPGVSLALGVLDVAGVTDKFFEW